MREFLSSQRGSATLVVLLALLIAGAAGFLLARDGEPVQGEAAAQVPPDVDDPVPAQSEADTTVNEIADLRRLDAAPARAPDSERSPQDDDPVRGPPFPTFSQAVGRVRLTIEPPACGEFGTSDFGGEPVDHNLTPSDPLPASVLEQVTDIGLSIEDLVRASRDHRLQLTRNGPLRLSTASGDRKLLGVAMEFVSVDNGSQDGLDWVLSEFAAFYECDEATS